MRLALLTGVAAISLIGAASAQAETYYVNEPAVVTTTPGTVYAVPAPPFGPFTPQYVVSQPTVVVTPAPVVAPRERVIERERVVVAPRQRAVTTRERVVERQRVIAPRERVVERVIAPAPVVESEQVVVAPPFESGIVTTGYSTSRSCFIDRNGFERCY
jgi:hypothetical protein